MAPPPLPTKAQLLPNKSIKAPFRRGINKPVVGGTKEASASARPSIHRGGPAVLSSTPAPGTVPLQPTPQLPGPPQSRPPTKTEEKEVADEELVRLAYTLYLQQGLLYDLTSKTNELAKKVSHRELLWKGLKCMVKDIYPGIHKDLLPNRLLKGIADTSVRTSKLYEVYCELRTEFEEGKVSTLEELKRALEARFSTIAIQNEGKPSEVGDLAETDLSDLIKQTKEHLTFMEENRNSHLNGTNTGTVAPDIPKLEFMARFVDAMKAIAEEQGLSTELKTEVEDSKITLLELMSSRISQLALNKECRRQDELPNERS